MDLRLTLLRGKCLGIIHPSMSVGDGGGSQL